MCWTSAGMAPLQHTPMSDPSSTTPTPLRHASPGTLMTHGRRRRDYGDARHALHRGRRVPALRAHHRALDDRRQPPPPPWHGGRVGSGGSPPARRQRPGRHAAAGRSLHAARRHGAAGDDARAGDGRLHQRRAVPEAAAQRAGTEAVAVHRRRAGGDAHVRLELDGRLPPQLGRPRARARRAALPRRRARRPGGGALREAWHPRSDD